MQALQGMSSPRYALGLLAVVACAGDPEPAADQPQDGPPDTEIFLADLVPDGDAWTISGLQNATNRPGYDNQPHFTPDGQSLLYTSGFEGQTDIYRVDLSTGTTHAVTRTPESEYSATPLPGGDGFSVIRVEADSMQRLWAFEWDGSPRGVLLERIAPVGYHVWVDADRVVMFILAGDSMPNTLRLGSLASGEADVIHREIGRSLHRIPNAQAISFVDRSTEEWTIMRLDPDTRSLEPIAPTLKGSEDYVWAPDGSIVMGSDAVLHRWDGSGWTVLADLTAEGIRNITRLAIHPDGRRIAIVADRR